MRALRGAGVDVSLPALVEQLDPEHLAVLWQSLPEPQQDVTDDYLDSLTPRQRTDLGGVRDRLAIMAESDVAPWLDPATAGAHTFDLLGAIEERAVVYFDLKADAWPLLARMLGVAIVQDLQTTMAALQHAPIPTVVVIDEFAAIAAEQVVHLFGRADRPASTCCWERRSSPTCVSTDASSCWSRCWATSRRSSTVRSCLSRAS